MSDASRHYSPISEPAEDASGAIARDLAAVSRIAFLPAMMRIVCQETGMGFAAVARVTEGSWTACAVRDEIGFGLPVGGQLDIHTTLCKESRARRESIAIDHASMDDRYREHHTIRLYAFESYVSVPIVLSDGAYFGNLCAIDRKPARASAAEVVAQFEGFAKLIAAELERTRAEDEREAALAEERATGAMREEFIAVLGHDLRNPLSAIFSSADLLVKRSESDLLKSAAQRIQSSARRMSRLIDDVMDFARGRLGGGLALRVADDPDAGSALLDVVAEARAAHPELDIRASAQPAMRVACDRARVQQLLSNLLGNAARHGDPWSPIVVDAALDGGALLVSVANRGKPIAPDHLRKIFEPYWRPPGGAASGGLGLGLHICSRIAEAHSGSMSASSSAEGLIRFEARLPVAGPPGWRLAE